MARIAVFGGTGYLASLIKNQNNVKKNNYTFFSRKKGKKNYINFLSLKKNLDILKNFDFIIHLAGPNQDQLKRNKRLIEKKNKITSMICNVCLIHNIKLIYISSMQVYKNYGKKNLYINSKANLKNVKFTEHLFTNQKKSYISINDTIIQDKNVNLISFNKSKFTNKKNLKLISFINNKKINIFFSNMKKNQLVIEIPEMGFSTNILFSKKSRIENFEGNLRAKILSNKLQFDFK